MSLDFNLQDLEIEQIEAVRAIGEETMAYEERMNLESGKRKLQRKLDAAIMRDDRLVLLDWRNTDEQINLYKTLFEHGFYISARFLGDYLLTKDVPITILRYSCHEHFQHLGYLNKTQERIEIAFLFEDTYLFNKWLNSVETKIYNRLKLNSNGPDKDAKAPQA